MSEPNPTALDLVDSRRTLAVSWDDGQRTEIPYRELRLACACAVCVEEMTGRPLLDPVTVPDDIGVENAEEVGLYGLRITWTGGHSTGIYTWSRLRDLGTSA